MGQRQLLVAVAAGLLVAGVASAEGLGDAAAREKSRRSREDVKDFRTEVKDCRTNATRPRLVSSPAPVYPLAARAEGVTGAVDMDVLVGRDGKVREIDVRDTGADARLVAAAREAVSQRLYCPAVVDGVAVEARVKVQVSFRR